MFSLVRNTVNTGFPVLEADVEASVGVGWAAAAAAAMVRRLHRARCGLGARFDDGFPLHDSRRCSISNLSSPACSSSSAPPPSCVHSDPPCSERRSQGKQGGGRRRGGRDEGRSGERNGEGRTATSLGCLRGGKQL
eukprot:scaffold83392_cov32-Tisochrysis_lutea.AAC.1